MSEPNELVTPPKPLFPWGSFTIEEMITNAINSHPRKLCTSDYIYEWVNRHVPYFCESVVLHQDESWKQRIKATMTTNPKFRHVRPRRYGGVERWTIDLVCEAQATGDTSHLNQFVEPNQPSAFEDPKYFPHPTLNNKRKYSQTTSDGKDELSDEDLRKNDTDPTSEYIMSKSLIAILEHLLTLTRLGLYFRTNYLRRMNQNQFCNASANSEQQGTDEQHPDFYEQCNETYDAQCETTNQGINFEEVQPPPNQLFDPNIPNPAEMGNFYSEQAINPEFVSQEAYETQDGDYHLNYDVNAEEIPRKFMRMSHPSDIEAINSMSEAQFDGFANLDSINDAIIHHAYYTDTKETCGKRPHDNAR